jgi:hypothetical protein
MSREAREADQSQTTILGLDGLAGFLGVPLAER